MGSIGHRQPGYYLPVPRVLLSILNCTPGVENILTRTQPIYTLPKIYSRLKSDVLKRATEYKTQFSIKKIFKIIFEHEFR